MSDVVTPVLTSCKNGYWLLVAALAASLAFTLSVDRGVLEKQAIEDVLQLQRYELTEEMVENHLNSEAASHRASVMKFLRSSLDEAGVIISARSKIEYITPFIGFVRKLRFEGPLRKAVLSYRNQALDQPYTMLIIDSAELLKTLVEDSASLTALKDKRLTSASIKCGPTDCKLAVKVEGASDPISLSKEFGVQNIVSNTRPTHVLNRMYPGASHHLLNRRSIDAFTNRYANMPVDDVLVKLTERVEEKQEGDGLSISGISLNGSLALYAGPSLVLGLMIYLLVCLFEARKRDPTRDILTKSGVAIFYSERSARIWLQVLPLFLTGMILIVQALKSEGWIQYIYSIAAWTICLVFSFAVAYAITLVNAHADYLEKAKQPPKRPLKIPLSAHLQRRRARAWH